jgi:hypothetical protein
MPRPWVISVVGGLVVGALSFIGQEQLDGTLDAFANAISMWLVAPFLVGALTATRTEAAATGILTCAAQLAGYYVIASLREFDTTGSLVAFWVACAVVGGPIFGIAGHLWRVGPHRGLGIAVLAGAFVAEGLYAYGHQLDDYVTAAVWVAIGLTFAVLATRGRPEHLRWLGLTIPLGLAGEAILATVLDRAF